MYCVVVQILMSQEACISQSAINMTQSTPVVRCNCVRGTVYVDRYIYTHLHKYIRVYVYAMSVRWSAEVRVAVALCSVWVCFAAFSVSPLSSPHQQQHRRHLNHHQYRGHVTHGLQCSVVERAITYSAAQGMTVPLSRPYESSTQDISPPLQEETPLLPPAPSDGPSAATSVLFTLLSALAILISYADRANISTTIVSMAQQYRWDSTFQGFVLTSFFGTYREHVWQTYTHIYIYTYIYTCVRT
jgi:hypothetical protein